MKTTLLIFALTVSVSVSTSAQDKDQIQKRDRIHQEDHLMYLDGKMYQIMNGEQTQLQNQITLKNGAVISPDGGYELKNQQREQLENGEYLDMNGNRYLNQMHFNQRKMMTQKEINRRHNMNKTNKTGPKNTETKRRGNR